MKQEIKRYFFIVVGSFIFALGINLFVVPVQLYSSGVLGIAQIIRTIIEQVIGKSTIDISGIINFLINIPLFMLAYRTISKRFFVRTLLSVISQTVFLTFIMIPTTPLVDDILTNCIIGGIVTGFGIGLTLRCSGSGGGLDILGVYFTKKLPHFSVGKLSLGINLVIYMICAFLFHIEIAIYSAIYTTCFTLVLDKTHYQNINVTCVIFTKHLEIQDKVLLEMGRGMTFWQGKGAYTKDDTYVMVTVISKYEVNHLKHILKEIDPQAFTLFFEGMSVDGHFEKRL